jgi:hypothetical protein
MAPSALRFWLRAVPCSILLGFATSSTAWSEEPAAAEVPLRRVVLYNSGVGFFEHRGEIDGNRQTELKIKVDEINDVLKSLFLRDFGGGHVTTVAYPSKEPKTQTRRTFVIDPVRQPALADLLRQMIGEPIELSLPLPHVETPITGKLLGVERRTRRTAKNEVEELDFINLTTKSGLRSVKMQEVVEIRIVDERLNEELHQTLDSLARSHATDKKTVAINFLGDGKRTVRIGYTHKTPIWKTTYRLELKDQDPPFLQGWAIVENATEYDWSGVDLTLISGRPISIATDLYEPRDPNGPLAARESPGSSPLNVGGQDSALKSSRQIWLGPLLETTTIYKGKPIVRTIPGIGYVNGAAKFSRGSVGRGIRGGQGIGGGLGGGMGSGTGSFAVPIEKKPSAQASNDPAVQQGVTLSASAENVGELFRYVIDTPVTIKRQQSAMLPIVNGSVKGEKLSIYNAQVHRKHPLNGLRLTNSTALHLMQGPMTVFDGGEYAGDARIEDMAPGSERLLSYALDLDTEVAPENKVSPQELVSARIAKGTLLTNFKLTRSQEYVVKNSGAKAKKLLIEYPIEEPWKLVSPEKPSEKTRGMYRFALPAEPGKPATLVINEEQLITQQLAVKNLDQDAILLYARSKAVSQAVKDMLAEIVSRKQSLATLVSQREQLQNQLQGIDQEQARIRENMDRLDRNSELYQRYVKKFVEQEDQVEDLRRQTKMLVEEEARARRALDDYMTSAEVQ